MNIGVEIQILPNDIYNCFDGITISVAHWKKKDYQMMFADCWNFRYHAGSPDDKRVYVNKDCRYDYLTRYHGLVLNEYKGEEPVKTLSVIKEELAKGEPVILLVDCFHCHWRKEMYHKLHRDHYCLVVDVNEQEEYLFVKDIQVARDGVTLSFEDFWKDQYEYLTISSCDEPMEAIIWQNVIRSSLEKVKNLAGSVNIFEEMRAFADDIPQIDLGKQVVGYESYPFKAPFFQRIFDLANGRNQYAELLKYLYQLSGVQELLFVAEKVAKSGDYWNSVFGMLSKAFYLQKPELIERIAKKVADIADEEERIADVLLDLVHHGTRKELVPSLPEQPKHRNLSRYQFVDLTSQYNNKGFASVTDTSCVAEFSYVKRFFVAEGVPTSRLWAEGQMQFEFPMIAVGQNDNIACSGDVITITPGEYTNLMVLGAAELGNHSEFILVKYADQHVEHVLLEFSSWLLMNQPKYGEAIIWEGQGAQVVDNQVDIYPFKVKLYAQNYHLKHQGVITELVLPVCPNLHVFSLTLAR